MITPLSALRAASLAAFAGLGTWAYAQAVITAPEVPEAIKAPAGEKVVFRVHALGAQIYLCWQNPEGKPQWVLKAPDAQLRNDRGAVVGHHGAGPSWKHSDGSEIVGKAVARVESPDGNSIPWLLLTATAHNGAGVFAHVTSVQRIHTQGGKAPDVASCDPAKDKDKEARSPYSADYYFYAAADTVARP